MALQLAEEELGRLAKAIREGSVVDAALLGRFDQLSRLDQALMIHAMAQAAAEVLPPSAVGRTSEQIARHITAEAQRVGVKFPVINSRRVDMARWIAQLPSDAKGRVRAGKSSVDAELARHRGWRGGKPAEAKRHEREHVVAQARIRAVHRENQLRSMANAPRGKLNIPALQRAEKIQDLLVDLIALEPAVAAESIPAVRCRDFTIDHAYWWLTFATLCEQRRVAETPELAPRHRKRFAATNPVLAGATPAMAALSPAGLAVLKWLTRQREPVTAADGVAGTKLSMRTVSQTLRQLCTANLAAIVGRNDRRYLYQAVRPDDDEEEETQD